MPRSLLTSRVLRTGCLLAAVLAFASCRRAASTDTLSIGAGADPDALVPVMVRGSQGAMVVDLLCDRLADIGPTQNVIGDGDFRPALAWGWTWNADSSQVTFHVNPKARWHDGVPVTAADVIWTFYTLRDSATASPNVGDLAMIDSVTARVGDPLAATVFFKSKQPDRFYWVTHSLVPMPKHYYGHVTGAGWISGPEVQRPVCSGPYRLESWKPKAKLVLAAVADHYRVVPKIPKVAFLYRGDAQSAAQSTMVGELDFWEGVTAPMIAEAATSTTVRLLPLPNFDYAFVAFHIAEGGTSQKPHPILSDPGLRRALAFAAHPDVIRRNVWGADSLARPLLGPFVRAQVTYDSTLNVPLADSVTVSTLLDARGWKRGPDGIRMRGTQRLALTAIVPSPARQRVSAATVLQAEWRKQGILLTFETLEFQTFLQRLNSRQYDLVFGAYRTSPSPFSILTTWGRAGIARGSNLAHFTAIPVQAQFDSAAASTDVATVTRHFRAAYRLMDWDPPAIWLYEPASYAVVSRRVQVPTFRTPFWWQSIPAWSLASEGPK